MSKELDVYLHEIYVGRLLQSISGGLSFIYDERYIEENHPDISISLPLKKELYEGDRVKVKAFFSVGNYPHKQLFIMTPIKWNSCQRRESSLNN